MSSGDTELPILDELKSEFQSMIAAELRNGDQRARLEPQARSRRRRQSQARRVTRRASIVLVLLCLVGGVALAARFGGAGSERRADTAPTLLHQGAAGAGWRLSGYRHDGRLCLAFSAMGDLTGECGAPPGERGVLAASLRTPGKRFVAGLAGPGVASVYIEVGAHRVAGQTHPATDPEAARAAGVPTGVRWFVVPLDAGAKPARVVPHDNTGRALGGGVLDCSLGVIGEACERAIQARARSALR